MLDSGHSSRMQEPITRCNGNIIGKVTEVENGSFTSRLDVIISSDVTGKSIDSECAFQNSTRVGSFTIPSFPIIGPGMFSYSPFFVHA